MSTLKNKGGLGEPEVQSGMEFAGAYEAGSIVVAEILAADN